MEEVNGKFMESLVRNNKKIRQDRAMAIAEDTQLLFKRKVEDLRIQITRMMREREGMLDLSPSDALSLKLASDFNSEEFVEKDLELGIKIRNTEIKLEVAEKRYNELFGTTPVEFMNESTEAKETE